MSNLKRSILIYVTASLLAAGLVIGGYLYLDSLYSAKGEAQKESLFLRNRVETFKLDSNSSKKDIKRVFKTNKTLVKTSDQVQYTAYDGAGSLPLELFKSATKQEQEDALAYLNKNGGWLERVECYAAYGDDWIVNYCLTTIYRTFGPAKNDSGGPTA